MVAAVILLKLIFAKWRVLLPAAGLLLAFAWHQASLRRAEEAGRRAAIAEIERSNKAAEGAADKAEQRVLTCPPELWSREQRKCVTKLH